MTLASRALTQTFLVTMADTKSLAASYFSARYLVNYWWGLSNMKLIIILLKGNALLCYSNKYGKLKTIIDNFLPFLWQCFSHFSVDLSTMPKTTPYISPVTAVTVFTETTPYISPVTTATLFTEPTKSSKVCSGYSLLYQKAVKYSVLFVLLRRLMNFL